MAGHMGKNKTAGRVMGQFYWPTHYSDVADHCRSCKECEMRAPGRAGRAPLIRYLSWKSHLRESPWTLLVPYPEDGKYILVGDYVTRYPEVFPLRSCDTEHVAEALSEPLC